MIQISRSVRLLLASSLTLSTPLFSILPANAASHREAPLIALDPSADNTDVYAFVSYDAANLARSPADRHVTFIDKLVGCRRLISNTSTTARQNGCDQHQQRYEHARMTGVIQLHIHLFDLLFSTIFENVVNKHHVARNTPAR